MTTTGQGAIRCWSTPTANSARSRPRSATRRHRQHGRRERAAPALRPVTFHYKQPYDDGSKPIDTAHRRGSRRGLPGTGGLQRRGPAQTVKYQDLAPLLLNEVQEAARREGRAAKGERWSPQRQRQPAHTSGEAGGGDAAAREISGRADRVPRRARPQGFGKPDAGGASGCFTHCQRPARRCRSFAPLCDPVDWFSIASAVPSRAAGDRARGVEGAFPGNLPVAALPASRWGADLAPRGASMARGGVAGAPGVTSALVDGHDRECGRQRGRDAGAQCGNATVLVQHPARRCRRDRWGGTDWRRGPGGAAVHELRGGCRERRGGLLEQASLPSCRGKGKRPAWRSGGAAGGSMVRSLPGGVPTGDAGALPGPEARRAAGVGANAGSCVGDSGAGWRQRGVLRRRRRRVWGQRGVLRRRRRLVLGATWGLASETEARVGATWGLASETEARVGGNVGSCVGDGGAGWGHGGAKSAGFGAKSGDFEAK